jgi:hypothetical protein
VLATLLLLAACTRSQVDPGATVTVTGTLQDQAGEPVAGRKVVLAPQTQVSELLGGTLFTALSLGTVCLADSPPEPCATFLRNSESVDSGGGGAFSFSLEGSEVRTFFGNARALGVSAGLTAPAGTVEGPALLHTFTAQTTELDLGPLRFWEPRVTLGTGSAEWDPASSDFGSGSGYQLEFTSGDGGPIWSSSSRAARVEYDPRVLEDSGGLVSVTARRRGVAMGTTTESSLRSAQFAFRGDAGAPPSRGKPCSVQSGDGPGVVVPSCGATDGRLSEPAKFPAPGPSAASGGTAGPAPAEPQWAVIDLGAPVGVSLVVLRGCACTVESSLDGTRWSTMGEVDRSDAGVTPSRGTRARFVRVGGEGQSLSALREISVWS